MSKDKVRQDGIIVILAAKWNCMEIKLNRADLIEIINEDIDRLAARSYSDDGVSLFDGIRIKSRDKGVQGRMLEERDARLRSLIAFCLGDKEEEDVIEISKDKDGKDIQTITGKNIVYEIMDGKCSKPSPSTMKVLLRKYLTDAVLYDWYTKHGIASSITYEDIEAQESKIVCTLRQGYTKKPLQPFGPR